MTVIRTMTLADALSVCARMRERDRWCLHALMGDIEHEAFAVNRWQTTGPAWVMDDADGVPLCIAGLSFSNDWTAVWWLIATDGMGANSWGKALAHARTVTRQIAHPRHEHYRHRVEAHVMADWPESQRWIQRLGFRHEGTRVAAGRGGEDVQTWVITGPAKEK